MSHHTSRLPRLLNLPSVEPKSEQVLEEKVWRRNYRKRKKP